MASVQLAAPDAAQSHSCRQETAHGEQTCLVGQQQPDPNGAYHVHSQLTPPATPSNSDDPLSSRAPTDVFHSYYRANETFIPEYQLSHAGEGVLSITIPLSRGDLVLVHTISEGGWANGTSMATGETGWLPTNYCSGFDHPYMRNLLSALTSFYELVHSTSDEGNLTTLIKQDFVRGLIAGVRILLQECLCVHRECELVKEHLGIRRIRKRLLADLSMVVQITNTLRNTLCQSYDAEVIHHLVDDLQTKTFKVVTRAVRFLDTWSTEAPSHLTSAVYSRAGEPSDQPPTPPGETNERITSQSGLFPVSPDTPGYDLLNSPVAREVSGEPKRNVRTEQAGVGLVRSSSKYGKRSWLTHRVSGSAKLDPRTKASARLSKAHDVLISHLGVIVGLHQSPRSAALLSQTTDDCVNAFEDFSAILRRIWQYHKKCAQLLESALTKLTYFQSKLVQAASNVFTLTDTAESQVVTMPGQGEALVKAATDCVKCAGECIAAATTVIERQGDMETKGTDCGVPETSEEEAASASEAGEKMLMSELEPDEEMLLEMKPPPMTESMPPPAVPRKPSIRFLFGRKPSSSTSLPKLDADAEANHSPPNDRKPLPPIPRLSTQQEDSRVLHEDSPPETPAGNTNTSRNDSVVRSAAESASTLTDSKRGSGISAISHTSTRATTPEPKSERSESSRKSHLQSFESMASIHSTTTEASSEIKSHFVTKTFAHELIVNKDQQVVGGSLPALIEKLTAYDSAPDPTLLTTFYLTFRDFATPREVARALIDRHDYVGDSQRYGVPARLRVYNFLKGWLETYWVKEQDGPALHDVRYFHRYQLTPMLPKAAKRFEPLIDRVSDSYTGNYPLKPLVSPVGKTSMSLEFPKQKHVPNISEKQRNLLREAVTGRVKCTVLDFAPKEIARQFTLLESHIFCAIHPQELLSLNWGDKTSGQAVNVRAMSRHSTDIANMTVDSVLSFEEPKKRGAAIVRWIKIAKACLELSNFDVLVSISASLGSSAVGRLARSWEYVPEKYKLRLEKYAAMCNIEKNHMSLRRHLEQQQLPCIPFVGMYLTDLTFVHVGNPKTRQLPNSTKSVINFDKHLRSAKIIAQIQRFQVPYEMENVMEMQAWINANFSRLRDEEKHKELANWRRSKALEPPVHTMTSDSTESRPKTARDRPDTVKEREKTFAGFKDTFGFRSALARHDLPPLPDADCGASNRS